MKWFLALFLLTYSALFSQNKEILFGFSEIPQSLLVNPGGYINNNLYVGVPLLSHVHANFGFSGVSAFDLFAEDGRDFNDKLQEVVYSLSNTDFFSINQQLEIFSGGFSTGKNFVKDTYWSFGLYQETDVFIYFPKDYAILAYEGNQTNIGRPFDLSDLNVKGEVLSVLHVGYNKKINNKFTAGVRAKIYSSIINFNSTNNSGRFLTRTGTDNFLRHEFDLNLQLQTSGFASLINDSNSDANNDVATLRNRLLFSGNMGLGFDIGFTYKPKEQITLEGSLQDVGFIRHAKDIENYNLDGQLVFEGINPVFPEIEDGQTADDYWDEVSNNFEDLFTVQETTEAYTTWRPVKLNLALRYAFGEKQSKECNCLVNDDGFLNEVGAQLFAINRPRQPNLALTTYIYRRLFKQMRLKATYTLDTFSFTNLGLGMSAHLGKANLYVMANNLLNFQNLAKAQSVSLQLGFNIIFDEKK